MRVGIIGAGHMGSGMALSLLRAGHAVTVWNRTAAKVEPLAAKGAKVAASVAEACAGDAVITMLANDEAAEEVVFGEGGLLANLPAGAVHISSSTISVAMAKRLAAAHAERGRRFVSAPVFGRPDVAAAGQLAVIAAGEPAALKQVTPLLDAVGRRTFVVGEDPATANLVKLSGNFLIASVIESLGEAMALVGKAGVDRQAYLELLTSTLFDAPVYRTYGSLIAENRFAPPSFAAPLGAKDIRLTLAAAEDLAVPMPVASLLNDRFAILMTAHGGERLDWSALGGLAANDSGERVLGRA